MTKRVHEKEFKGSDYWYSLSMDEKFAVHVMMSDTWEDRLWMFNENCEIDETLYFHLIDLGYFIKDDLADLA